MATRNLTNRYIEIRAQFQHNRIRIPSYTGHQKLLDDVPRQHLPPVWVDIVDAINADISTIQKHVTELSHLHNERLKVSFNDHEHIQDQSIEELTRETTRLFRQCEKRLKQIAVAGSNTTENLPYQERVMRLNVMRAVGARVQNLSKSFRTIQKEFLLKLKGQETSGNKYFDDGRKVMTDIDKGFNEEQMAIMKEREINIEEKEAEIRKIARSTNELQQIFSEISILVVEQGSILDRIDYHIEQALSNVKSGNKDILQAEEYQKSTRSIWCIAILLVIIIILSVILGYKVKGKSD